MRLWLNRTGEVSLREQLITQVVLGILCKELLPGQRLPSTRELARRFGIHANTASAAYRELEHEGWLEFHHGSGVYVRATQPSTPLSLELAAGAPGIPRRPHGCATRRVVIRPLRNCADTPDVESL